MKASIVFLSYNHAPFVAAALRSALSQEYPEFELVIHDDGSTDGTLEIIENILAHEVPAHVTIVMAGDGKNHGMVESFSRAMSVATGEIIMHISGDDISYPHRLSRVMDIFQKHSDVMLVVSDTHRIDDQGDFVNHPSYAVEDTINSYDKSPRHIYGNTPVLGAAGSYRSSIIKKFGKITPDYCQAEDNVYWVRALLLGKIYYIAEPLIYYRLHNLNASENGWKWRMGITNALKAAHIEFVRKHGLNFLQWEIDIKHALSMGYINQSRADELLEVSKYDACWHALLASSLSVAPWREWIRLALENKKCLGTKIIMSMLKLRLSSRRRERYWTKHQKAMTCHLKA